MADKKTVEYVILVSTDLTSGLWKFLGSVEVPAGSRAATAKREGLKQYQPEGGTVVAIQAADWTPEDLRPQLSFA